MNIDLNTLKDHGRKAIAKTLKVASVLTVMGLIQSYPMEAIVASVPQAESVKDISVTYDGETKTLNSYLGSKATLVINVASQCALTPQYEELSSIHKIFKGLKYVEYWMNM